MDRKSIGNTVMLKEENFGPDVRDGNILIPDIVKDETKYWRVVELGTGCKDSDGIITPFKVNVGDLLIIDIENHAPTTMLWENEKVLIINQNAILAKVEEK